MYYLFLFLFFFFCCCSFSLGKKALCQKSHWCSSQQVSFRCLLVPWPHDFHSVLEKRKYSEVAGVLWSGLGVQSTKNKSRRWWGAFPLRHWSGGCSVAGLGLHFLLSEESLFHKKWSISTKCLLLEKCWLGRKLLFIFEDESSLKHKYSLTAFMIRRSKPLRWQ